MPADGAVQRILRQIGVAMRHSGQEAPEEIVLALGQRRPFQGGDGDHRHAGIAQAAAQPLVVLRYRRLVEQDVDADRPDLRGAQPLDQVGQECPVHRRPAGQRHEAVFPDGDHRDAAMLGFGRREMADQQIAESLVGQTQRRQNEGQAEGGCRDAQDDRRHHAVRCPAQDMEPHPADQTSRLKAATRHPDILQDTSR